EGTNSQLYPARRVGDPRGRDAGDRPGRDRAQHRRGAPGARGRACRRSAAVPVRGRRHPGDPRCAGDDQSGAAGTRHLSREREHHPGRGNVDRGVWGTGDHRARKPRRYHLQPWPLGGRGGAGRPWARGKRTQHPWNPGQLLLGQRLRPRRTRRVRAGGDGDQRGSRRDLQRFRRRGRNRAAARRQRVGGARLPGAGCGVHGAQRDGRGVLVHRHPGGGLPCGRDRHRRKVEPARGGAGVTVRKRAHHHRPGSRGGRGHGGGVHPGHPGERGAAGGSGWRFGAQHAQPPGGHGQPGRGGERLPLGPAPDQRRRAPRGGQHLGAGDARLVLPHQSHRGGAHLRGGRVGGGGPRALCAARPRHHQGELRRQLRRAV
ncbi:MAG: hypothetical protein AVDCRST_MAG89-1573, partial [uncultured Gemmatimonadetes bacterium]